MLKKTIANSALGLFFLLCLFLIICNLFVQDAMAEEEFLADVTNYYWCTTNCGSVFTANICRDGGAPYVKFVVQFPESYESDPWHIYYFDSFESPYEIRNFIGTVAGAIPIVGTYDTTNRKFTGIASLAGKSDSYIIDPKGNNTECSPGFYYKFHTSWAGTYYAWLYYGCMPEGSPNIYINPQWFNYYPNVNLTMTDNQELSDEAGNNILSITGTVRDQNAGDPNTVKYSIEGVSAHQNIAITNITADGTDIPFSYGINIDNTIPPGEHQLKVWATDSYGNSTEETCNFTVVKTVGSSGEPYIRVVTSEGKAFNFDNTTGNYSDVTSTAMVNNFGSSRPFYLKECTHKLNGTDNTFYDYGSTSAYIGNYLMRVVTSEGRAFDVDIDNGSYTEVTDSFINNNFGSGKPFYLKEDAKYINGYGPFMFYDFGSTMAYIGNNTFRVVTAEGKAFDVDKDTGSYTEVTSTFLINNWGSGKPFYLREYSQTIGVETHTFYDFGSSMCYLGDNIIRVVTSENKVFDVNKDTGAYTDVTSTVPSVCFGSGKPFYNRTYTANIGGTDYTFYDFGTSMAYMKNENPRLMITTSLETAAFETITLSGSASDTGNNSITVSASIAEVSKSTVVSNTSTPQQWTLTWDIVTDSIPDGTYSNIVVTADNGTGEISMATYRGNINVYGVGSNVTRNTIHYEYDSNGKLLRRYVVTSP